MTYNVYCQECLDEGYEEAYAEWIAQGKPKDFFFDLTQEAPTPETRPHLITTGIKKPCRKHGGVKDPEWWFKELWPDLYK